MTFTDGFDFTLFIEDVISDFIKQTPYFQKFEVDKIIILTGRGKAKYGKLAETWPEKTLERYNLNLNGEKYAIKFYIPRFLRQKGKERMQTVVHELYHISPEFDGKLNVLDHKVKKWHGGSKKAYNKKAMDFVEEWYKTTNRKDLLEFLDMPLKEIYERYKGIKGNFLRRRRSRWLSKLTDRH